MKELHRLELVGKLSQDMVFRFWCNASNYLNASDVVLLKKSHRMELNIVPGAQLLLIRPLSPKLDIGN